MRARIAALFLMCAFAFAIANASAAEFCVCEARPVPDFEGSRPGIASSEFRGYNETTCYGLARNWAVRKCVAGNRPHKCAVVKCGRVAH